MAVNKFYIAFSLDTAAIPEGARLAESVLRKNADGLTLVAVFETGEPDAPVSTADSDASLSLTVNASTVEKAVRASRNSSGRGRAKPTATPETKPDAAADAKSVPADTDGGVEGDPPQTDE